VSLRTDQREEEMRRRYDRGGVLAGCGPVGAAVVAVIDTLPGLDLERCGHLHAAYNLVSSEAEGAGWRGPWEEVFAYSLPYPEHPGNLYAIAAWSRIAFDYAGLVGSERARAVAAGGAVVPVGRTAAAMVMALSVDLAGLEGWYHPVSVELAGYLRRPWEMVMGSPTQTGDLPTGPPAPPGDGQ
jgi:hypothetical protein